MSARQPAGEASASGEGPAPSRSDEDDTPLTESAAEAYIAGICFKTGPPGRVGVELEWLVHDRHDPGRTVPYQRVADAVEGVPLAHGHLSYEPGCQLEYSSTVAGDLAASVAATTADLDLLRRAGAAAGLDLVGYGVDPHRPPRRTLDRPRYRAMERFFDREGSAGRLMMGSSASVQVCLDAGDATAGKAGFARSWPAAHALGPLFTAALANSPLVESRPTGWASTRQDAWARMDPTRTAPALRDPFHPRYSPGLTLDWARYALDAKVMCIRDHNGGEWAVPAALTFRDWIRQRRGRPTTADLDYHLTTLFPPVRPRGYLEFRMIDAQPDDGWRVPVAVATVLLDDPIAADAALAAVEPLWATAASTMALWRRAARRALADPGLAAAARACFRAAVGALPPGRIRTAVESFAERYVERG